MNLPQGFKLEDSNQDTSGVKLPPGFKLEDSVMAPPPSGLFGTRVGEDSKGVQFLRNLAATSKKGLKSITDLIPDAQTTSVPLNVALNTPKTLAEIGSEASANMLQPESILTAGALEGANLASPAINAAGRFIGSGAEKLSGLAYDTPGVLARTVENPSLPFKPGVEAANETYGQLIDKSQVRPEIAMNMDKKDLVQKAYEAVKDGSITPDEAFIARKTIGQVKNSVPQDTFYTLRGIFDDIAKTKFAGADTARTIAEDAENLRNVAPLNKSGTTSIFKTGIGLAGAGGAHFSPYAALTVPAFSPAVQAGLASGIGVARQGLAPLLANSAETGIGLSAYLNRNR